MKSTSLFLFFLGFFCFAQSQDLSVNDKGCLGNYKCCKFTEIAGVVTCTQMCEPQIACKHSEYSENQAEVVEETIQPIAARKAFTENIRTVCRKGFRLVQGIFMLYS